MNIINATCMICNDKNPYAEERALQNIEHILNRHGIKDTNDRTNVRFLWNVNKSCHYGMSCPTLEQYNRKCNTLGRSLENRLVSVAKSDNKAALHEILQNLRGYFPQVYRQLDMLSKKIK